MVERDKEEVPAAKGKGCEEEERKASKKDDKGGAAASSSAAGSQEAVDIPFKLGARGPVNGPRSAGRNG